jgi:hypothetical protein
MPSWTHHCNYYGESRLVSHLHPPLLRMSNGILPSWLQLRHFLRCFIVCSWLCHSCMRLHVWSAATSSLRSGKSTRTWPWSRGLEVWGYADVRWPYWVSELVLLYWFLLQFLIHKILAYNHTEEHSNTYVQTFDMLGLCSADVSSTSDSAEKSVHCARLHDIACELSCCPCEWESRLAGLGKMPHRG